jgi:hypothetical protein
MIGSKSIGWRQAQPKNKCEPTLPFSLPMVRCGRCMLAIVQSAIGEPMKVMANGWRNMDVAHIHPIMQVCTCKPESYRV